MGTLNQALSLYAVEPGGTGAMGSSSAVYAGMADPSASSPAGD
jgi:hypothetical protein